MDAHPGVEHRVLVGQRDAPLGRFDGGAGQQDVAHASLARPFQDAGDLLRHVLVQVGVGVAVDGHRWHKHVFRVWTFLPEV